MKHKRIDGTMENEKSRKRILVPIVGKGSIVHLVRTGLIDKMNLFCTPIIGFTWQQDDLIKELVAKGYEVHVLPSYNVTDEYRQLRKKIDQWYFKFVLKTPSTNIQRKLKNAYRPGKKAFKLGVRENYEKFKALFVPSYAKRNIQRETELIKQQQVYEIFNNWLNDKNIDGLFTVTPFLHEVELFARLLKQQGKMVMASIHSFDNITKRGWPALVFDCYFVWNRYNKQELLRINNTIKDEQVFITGAPQFDFHFNSSCCFTKEEWLYKMGIPKGKKIVLYAGSVPSLFPDEPQYAIELNRAIEAKIIVEDIVILLRNHPLDNIERWNSVIQKSPSVFFDIITGGDKKMDFSNVTDDELKQFISTLKYTDVHINLCSTMAVDGSVFNKPQIGPAYNETNRQQSESVKNMYYQEHYLPVMKTGVVKLAYSSQQLVQLVNDALQNPAEFIKQSQDCVREIITYTDGKSAQRVSEKLKTFFAA